MLFCMHFFFHFMSNAIHLYIINKLHVHAEQTAFFFSLKD